MPRHALTTELEAVADDVAAIPGAYQPLDSDLTAIAALTTTSFGRGLLALADAAAARTDLGLGALATLGTVPAYPSSHAVLPVVRRPNSYVTWFPASSAAMGSGFASGATTVASETWTYSLPCRAGTWRVDTIVRKTSASGIITFAFNGSTIGTVDCYNASNVTDQAAVVSTSVTVPSDGTYDLVLTNPTKGTGSGYVFHVQAINLTRTGS